MASIVRLFRTFAVCLTVFACTNVPAADSGTQPIRIAIQANATGSIDAAFIEESQKYLLYSLPHLPLVFETLTFDQIQALAEERKIDFALTSPDNYAVLERFFGARSLISQKIKESDSADSSVAVTVLTQANDAAPAALETLNNVTVLIGETDGFLAKIFSREMIHAGVRDFVFEPVPGSTSTQTILKELQTRHSTVGVIEACFYERNRDAHPEWFTGLKFLTTERITETACRSSSVFYPGWTLSSFSYTDSMISRSVSGALLGMPTTSAGDDWTTGAHYSVLHELLETIGEANYRRQTQFNWQNFLYEYRWLFALAALIVLGLVIHMFRSEVLIRRRTEELVKTMREKQAIEHDAKIYNERLVSFERVGLVGELSSMIAHELKQPLAVIRNYARGLSRTLNHDEVDPELIKSVITKIDQQSTKASDIIDHVRSFAKRKTAAGPICMSDILTNAVEKFETTHADLTDTSIEPNLWVVADALEIELIVSNLLKNAADALSTVETPKIHVTLTHFDDQVVLQVRDNGPRLTDEQFAALTVPLNSSKPQGLGLGLVIVRRIVESARGSLSFERMDPCGLCITASFPACDTLEKQV